MAGQTVLGPTDPRFAALTGLQPSFSTFTLQGSAMRLDLARLAEPTDIRVCLSWNASSGRPQENRALLVVDGRATPLSFGCTEVRGTHVAVERLPESSRAGALKGTMRLL